MTETDGGATYQVEMEIMEAAYGDEFQLIQSCSSLGATFEICMSMAPRPFTVKFHVPVEFPEKPISVDVEVHRITKDHQAHLLETLRRRIAENPEVTSMEILQLASDTIDAAENGEEDRLQSQSQSQPQSQSSLMAASREFAPQASGDGVVLQFPTSVSIARFLVYFHHIMSSHKRRCILESARCLSLGGFSKHGYPGCVIIEGLLEDVLEWVRQIQQLRWKFMVVRGEDIEILDISMLQPFPSSSSRSPVCTFTEAAIAAIVKSTIDKNRKLPVEFMGEIESMSEAGAICKSCGLHDLFLTVMKK